MDKIELKSSYTYALIQLFLTVDVIHLIYVLVCTRCSYESDKRGVKTAVYIVHQSI